MRPVMLSTIQNTKVAAVQYPGVCIEVCLENKHPRQRQIPGFVAVTEAARERLPTPEMETR